MARYDLYKDVAQAGQIVYASPRNIKSYAVGAEFIVPGKPVRLFDHNTIELAGASDFPIIGITCFLPLHNEIISDVKDQVSVLTKGRVYVIAGAPYINELDIAYLEGLGGFTNEATDSHGNPRQEVGIFLSSAKHHELVILQFDLSAHVFVPPQEASYKQL